MYIGKTPALGNYQKCDAITTSTTATYNLLVGGVAVSPETANNCIVSLNGVIQAPGASGGFTISGSQIIFNSALTSADVIDFILVLGDVLDIGTPSDDTVTLAKLASGTDGEIISWDASGNPVAIGAGTSGHFLKSQGAGSQPVFAAAGGGKIGQVLQAHKADKSTYATQTFADIPGMTIDITPAATSSKILVLSDIMVSHTSGYSSNIRLMRDSTAIHLGTAASNRPAVTKQTSMYQSNIMYSLSFIYLDSPSTTSATTYKIQWMPENLATATIGSSVADGDVAYVGRSANTITVMEVLA
jgi:hypothetical protein